ncbi:MAG: hypothetical protein ABJ215_17370 [Alphaproteobacteria bacterium]
MHQKKHARIETLADELVDLYDCPFGGKPRGRFRVSMKLLGKYLGKRRLWPEDIEAVARALYERGYVSIDMDSYLVVLSHKTFANYRRVNEAALENRPDGPGHTLDARDPAQGSA